MSRRQRDHFKQILKIAERQAEIADETAEATANEANGATERLAGGEETKEKPSGDRVAARKMSRDVIIDRLMDYRQKSLEVTGGYDLEMNKLIDRASATIDHFEQSQLAETGEPPPSYYTASDYEITYINQYLLQYSSKSSDSKSSQSDAQPLTSDRIETIMDDVRNIIESLLVPENDEIVIGMDTETGVFQWEWPTMCHVVQLSSTVTKSAVVIHISSFTDKAMFQRLSKILFKFFEKTDRILVYGGSDLSMLFSTLNKDTPNSDHKKVTNQLHSKVLDLAVPYLGSSKGLKGTAEKVLGLALDKRYQCAYWKKKLLKPEEISYAAIDAIVLPQILQKVLENNTPLSLAEIIETGKVVAARAREEAVQQKVNERKKSKHIMVYGLPRYMCRHQNLQTLLKDILVIHRTTYDTKGEALFITARKFVKTIWDEPVIQMETDDLTARTDENGRKVWEKNGKKIEFCVVLGRLEDAEQPNDQQQVAKSPKNDEQPKSELNPTDAPKCVPAKTISQPLTTYCSILSSPRGPEK